MIRTPECPKCAVTMVFAYAVRVPAREADVRVYYCLPCKETVAQTWLAGTYIGDGAMPLFMELRT